MQHFTPAYPYSLLVSNINSLMPSNWFDRVLTFETSSDSFNYASLVVISVPTKPDGNFLSHGSLSDNPMQNLSIY